MRISDWSSDVCASDLVSDRRGFAVDRRADEEQPAVVHIDQASIVVDDRRFAADRLKGGVIEFLRCLKVVRSDHIVTVHGFSAPPDSGCESIPTLPLRSGPAAIMSIGTASCRARVCSYV